jgi:hypothetical protein
MEVSGVADERNDDDVVVSLYQGMDPLRVDSDGKVSKIPGQSQRVEPGGLLLRLRGKIVNGVLQTEPSDDLTILIWHFTGNPVIRGMRLRLALTPWGAEGLQAGYVDVEGFWQEYSRSRRILGAVAGGSGPSARAALLRLADGYKDPRTGRCTALSMARNLVFVRAHVIHSVRDRGEEIGQ